ncbi:hypothetical protein PIROE2DRAFT_3592 [Piromyces sp. E2]|nr:hypothetical protein PIROE2DRAFT_3592 [Piromyces sp. E2]|eukprot:OUM68611.1 hypothetical protein PIROE2DRAFT_3592 [Piromyces sp. E2]
MSWIYKRYIALKIAEIIIPNIFNYIGIDTAKKNNESIDKINFNFEIQDSNKINIVELVENCIERVKPLSKSKAKGNKKRKLNDGKELQKHDSQLSILMPRLSKELIQWYYQCLVNLNQISNTTNFKIFKFEKNLTEWCKELKEKFPINKYIHSVVASGIYLNFTLSKAEFLKLQLYTIPFILSKSEQFMVEQKKIIDSTAKKLSSSEKINVENNIALYFTPVKLHQILSSSSTHNINVATEAMSNHIKSLTLSNFISKLYLSNNDIVNYLKCNAQKSNKNEINNSIFITRYIEDCNSLAKLLYMDEKNDNKLSNMINNNNNNVAEKEQDIVNEIYHMMVTIDEKFKQSENSILEKKIHDIEKNIENNSRFLFDNTSTEKMDEKSENRKLIIQTIRSLLSKRYLNGVQRFLNITNDDSNKKSLEIYNELTCSHPQYSILGGVNKINNFNIKNMDKENVILYWIFGIMYEQKVLKNEEGQAITLDSSYENKSLIEKGKQVLCLIKKSLESIYIDLESIDFSHNKNQKLIPIIKNLKQGRIYLKNITKEVDSENNKVSINEELSEICSDISLIINRVLNVGEQKPLSKLIFVNNINREHHYMQLISLLEWIQYCCEKEGKSTNVSGVKTLKLKDYNNQVVKVFVGTEWEIVSHGRVDNLWDLSMLDTLNLTSNKITLDLNFLIDASKIEMSEVIESNIEKYRDMERELQNEEDNVNEEYTSVKSVDEIIEISGVSSIVLQNLQYRRMKNYKYEWVSSSNNDNDNDNDFDDFDDFSNNKKSNIGLYLQYIYAKICR